jgi:hypothetical protein
MGIAVCQMFPETLGAWIMRLKPIPILHQDGIKNDEVASQEEAAVCSALKPTPLDFARWLRNPHGVATVSRGHLGF